MSCALGSFLSRRTLTRHDVLVTSERMASSPVVVPRHGKPNRPRRNGVGLLAALLPAQRSEPSAEAVRERRTSGRVSGGCGPRSRMLSTEFSQRECQRGLPVRVDGTRINIGCGEVASLRLLR